MAPFKIESSGKSDVFDFSASGCCLIAEAGGAGGDTTGRWFGGRLAGIRILRAGGGESVVNFINIFFEELILTRENNLELQLGRFKT